MYEKPTKNRHLAGGRKVHLFKWGMLCALVLCVLATVVCVMQFSRQEALAVSTDLTINFYKVGDKPAEATELKMSVKNIVGTTESDKIKWDVSDHVQFVKDAKIYRLESCAGDSDDNYELMLGADDKQYLKNDLDEDVDEAVFEVDFFYEEIIPVLTVNCTDKNSPDSVIAAQELAAATVDVTGKAVTWTVPGYFVDGNNIYTINTVENVDSTATTTIDKIVSASEFDSISTYNVNATCTRQDLVALTVNCLDATTGSQICDSKTVSCTIETDAGTGAQKLKWDLSSIWGFVEGGEYYKFTEWDGVGTEENAPVLNEGDMTASNNVDLSKNFVLNLKYETADPELNIHYYDESKPNNSMWLKDDDDAVKGTIADSTITWDLSNISYMFKSIDSKTLYVVNSWNENKSVGVDFDFDESKVATNVLGNTGSKFELRLSCNAYTAPTMNMNFVAQDAAGKKWNLKKVDQSGILSMDNDSKEVSWTVEGTMQWTDSKCGGVNFNWDGMRPAEISDDNFTVAKGAADSGNEGKVIITYPDITDLGDKLSTAVNFTCVMEDVYLNVTPYYGLVAGSVEKVKAGFKLVKDNTILQPVWALKVPAAVQDVAGDVYTKPVLGSATNVTVSTPLTLDDDLNEVTLKASGWNAGTDFAVNIMYDDGYAVRVCDKDGKELMPVDSNTGKSEALMLQDTYFTTGDFAYEGFTKKLGASLKVENLVITSVKDGEGNDVKDKGFWSLGSPKNLAGEYTAFVEYHSEQINPAGIAVADDSGILVNKLAELNSGSNGNAGNNYRVQVDNVTEDDTFKDVVKKALKGSVPEGAAILTVSIIDSNGIEKKNTTFDKDVEVRIPVKLISGYKKGNDVKVYHIHDDGTVDTLTATIKTIGKETYAVVKVRNFSTFVFVPVEAASGDDEGGTADYVISTSSKSTVGQATGDGYFTQVTGLGLVVLGMGAVMLILKKKKESEEV